MKLIFLLIILLSLPGCSKAPGGGSSFIEGEHHPFYQVEPADVNYIPQIHDNIFYTVEDTALSATLNATDEDNDELTFEVAQTTVNGTLTIDATTGALAYQPAPEFFGIDQFTLKVRDGAGSFTTKIIFISILSKIDISGSLVLNSVTPTKVEVDFSQLVMDDGADLNICLSEDSNEDEVLDASEHCNVLNSTKTISLAGDSSTWTPTTLESGFDNLTFTLSPCNDKKVFAVAEIIGLNNTQIVTSPLYKKMGWTPSCLAGTTFKLWLNSFDSSSFETNYVTTSVLATASAGATTLTTNSNPSVLVPVGSRIKLGNDEVDVVSVTSNSITISSALTQALAAQAVKVMTIVKWNDVSGQGRVATQSNPGRQPFYTTNGINAHPSVMSDGTVRGLSVSGMTYNEFSIFMVTREKNVNAVVQSYIAKRNNVGEGQFIFTYDANNNNISWDQDGEDHRLDTGFEAQANTTYIYNWTRKSGEKRYQFIDGSLNFSSSDNPDRSNASRLDIGHENHAIGRSLNGYIGEVIILSKFTPEDIRVKVEGYLAWKWGLQSKLPSSHPYKTHGL